MELFKLFGSIMVDNEAANKSISETDSKAEGLGKKFLSGVGSAAKWGLGVAAAAGAVATGMFKAAEGAAKAADTIDKGSIRMGISKESYQELSYAAGQCGVEMGVMEKAAKKLEGTDLNLDDAMNQIMSLTSEEERSAKAAELFGETVAYQMAPLLAAGEEGFNGLKDRAHDLGLVMSDEAVDAGVKLGDTIADVKDAFGAIVTRIGTEVMPIIQTLLDWILEHMPQIEAVLNKVFEVIGFVVRGIVDFWNAYLSPVFNQIVEFVINTLAPAFMTGFQNIANFVSTAFTAIAGFWTGTLQPIFNDIITFLTGVFTGNWQQAFEGLSNIVGRVFEGMKAVIKAPLNGMIGLINGFIDKINSISVPDWVPGIGGKSANIGHIPMLARGGRVIGEGQAIVGEEGPELIELPSGAKVTPLGGGGYSPKVEELLTNVLEVLSEYLPNAGNAQLVLDTGVLVGETVKEYDKALGMIQRRKERGR